MQGGQPLLHQIASMFNVNHTNMDLVVMPVEQLRTLLVEACSIALSHNHPQVPAPDTELYAGFKWLSSVCDEIPESTLRVKSAAGKIPGTRKVGKRVLYEKAAVLQWLRDLPTRQPAASLVELEEAAEKQFESQLRTKQTKIKRLIR